MSYMRAAWALIVGSYGQQEWLRQFEESNRMLRELKRR